MSGTLHSIVNQEFDSVDEGNYVLCDLDGQRKMYKASHQGSDIARSLIGLKKDDVVSVEIGFEEKNVKVIAICNKYRKLAFDIMQESLDGSNPFMKPFKIDMNNPLESLESMMKKFTGDEMSPAEREKLAVEKYNRGDYSLMQMVDDVNIIAGYYKLLFTSFNVHTAPCREAVYKMKSGDLNKLEFVLDLPSVILFSEFTALRGTEINCKAKITSLLKEHITTFCKSPSRFMEADMFEAMQSKSIKHYSEYVDVDAKTHVEKLSEWVDSHCDVIIPAQALPLITQGDRSPLKDEIIASLSTLLQPNYVFVTDDIKLKQMLPMVNIITSETFVKLFNEDSVSEEYSEFLFDCHFDGIDMSEGFIIDQYMKMSYQKENDFVRVIQNMMSNPLLIDRINNVGMKLVDRVLGIRLLRITLVNMYSMALKGLSPIAVDNIAQIAKVEMNVNVFAMQFVRQCLLDAIFIVRNN